MGHVRSGSDRPSDRDAKQPMTYQTIEKTEMNQQTNSTTNSPVAAFAADPLNLLEVMHTTQAEFDFVLPGMLAGTVGSLVSPGGVGKSFFALQLALLVGTGHDLLGLDHPVKIGRVAMLCLEDPEDALRHRIHALGKYLPPEVRAKMHEQVQIFALLGKKTNIFDPPFFGWVQQAARGTRLVIIDTLRRVHSEDENDAAKMSDLLARLEQIAEQERCAILFLHHTTKNAALGGQTDVQQASRGSSVLTDNIRWQSYLAVMTDGEASKHGVQKDERRRHVRFGVSKQNYGPPLDELWLERGQGGVLGPSTIRMKASLQGGSTEGVDPKPAAKKLPKSMVRI